MLKLTTLNSKLKKPDIILFYVSSSWHILWNSWYILRVNRDTMFSFQTYKQRNTSSNILVWLCVGVPGNINWKKLVFHLNWFTLLADFHSYTERKNKCYLCPQKWYSNELNYYRHQSCILSCFDIQNTKITNSIFLK